MAAKFAVTGDQFVVIDDRMREVKRQLRLKDGSPLDPELVAEALQRIVEGRFEILVPTAEKPEVAPTIYPVTVDYSRTLEQMIAAGRYDSWNSDINTENFPINGIGQVKVELHLVHLNKVATTDEAMAEMDRRDLRPATLPELLALGVKYPSLQKEFPIVAIGSVWRLLGDRRCVAFLGGWDGGRRLYLGWIGGDWDGYCRFLAVRK